MAGAGTRFFTLADVAEILNISITQVYALVRRGELPAIKIGGRGQWRVESVALEGYIESAYSDAKEFIDSHPFTPDDAPDSDRPTPDNAPAEDPTVTT